MVSYCKCGKPLEGYETTVCKFCMNVPPNTNKTRDNRNMKRELRYAVIKFTDARAALTHEEREQLMVIMDNLADYRKKAGKRPLQCVVVEDDWPEYEPTWEAIAKRVDAEKKSD